MAWVDALIFQVVVLGLETNEVKRGAFILVSVREHYLSLRYATYKHSSGKTVRLEPSRVLRQGGADDEDRFNRR